MKRLLALIFAALTFLAACDDPHKGQHCVHSHTETIYVNGACMLYQTTNNVSICLVYQRIPIPESVCDQWVKDTPNGRETN